MHNGDQDQTVGQRDVDQEPDLEKPLQGVLVIEIVFRGHAPLDLIEDFPASVVEIAPERPDLAAQSV